MIYLYLFGTCFHFIYVFMIIGKFICGGSTFNVGDTGGNDTVTILWFI